MAKVVTFGEIMLRLKSPGYERLFQSPSLEATFGGGEANVSVSLANYGMDTAFVSVLPKNDIAQLWRGCEQYYPAGRPHGHLLSGNRRGAAPQQGDL